MKCEFLTECGMCTMKSKVSNTPIYCSHVPQYIHKYFWTGEEIKNAILKFEETKPTQNQPKKDIEAESEEKNERR